MTWSADDSKSAVCSGVSIPPLILKVGVPVFVVVLIGNARFSPQSPLFSDVFGVSSAALMG